MPFEKFTYAVRAENADGAPRYFAAFVDGGGNPQEVEIPREVYLALEACRRDMNRQIASIKRHQERLALSEGQLAARVNASHAPMEERVDAALSMQAALASLTETQRQRFLLYHEYGLNVEQIATVEDCAHPAIVKAISTAQQKLEKYFLEEGYKTGV